MFFYNKYKRSRKTAHIREIFEKAYEMQFKVKLGKNIVMPILFPRQKLCIIHGEYDNTNKNIIEMEESGIKVFNIPYHEDVYKTCGRLLFILKSIK